MKIQSLTMKQILLSLISFLMPAVAFSATQFVYNELTYEIIDAAPGTVKLVGFTKIAEAYNKEYVEVPSVVTDRNGKSYTVTELGNNCFYKCSELKQVSLPNTLTSIGNYVFQETGLTEVRIPENVKSVGYQFCYKCTELKTVYIGAGVTELPKYFCGQCQNLGSVTVNSKTPPAFPQITDATKTIAPFYNVPIECVLYVPQGSLPQYYESTFVYYIPNVKELISEIQLISIPDVTIGEGQQQDVVIKDSDGIVMPASDFNYQTSDHDVAYVSSRGTLFAHHIGEAVVTCTHKTGASVSFNATVTASEQPVYSELLLTVETNSVKTTFPIAGAVGQPYAVRIPTVHSHLPISAKYNNDDIPLSELTDTFVTEPATGADTMTIRYVEDTETGIALQKKFPQDVVAIKITDGVRLLLPMDCVNVKVYAADGTLLRACNTGSLLTADFNLPLQNIYIIEAEKAEWRKTVKIRL